MLRRCGHSERIHITDNLRQAEDRALDAAHTDRTAGKTTIVISQTSNEHLDELNARAQAIRHQHDELGPAALSVPGRPYALHPGDEIQIRRTILHPEHGQLRNGTTARIADINPDRRTVNLQLADGQDVTLDREQAARADLRLAYVQHPFPAQGQTTDTAHLIIGEHATQEGSYVALTRAREQTHIHAASAADQPATADPLQALTERISRAEPEVPSIHTPLAHESAITTELARTNIDNQHNTVALRPGAERSEGPEPIPELRTPVSAPRRACDPGPAGDASARDRGPTRLEPYPGISSELPATDLPAGPLLDERLDREWPRSRHRNLAAPQLNAETARTQRHGWEP